MFLGEGGATSVSEPVSIAFLFTASLSSLSEPPCKRL